MFGPFFLLGWKSNMKGLGISIGLFAFAIAAFFISSWIRFSFQIMTFQPSLWAPFFVYLIAAVAGIAVIEGNRRLFEWKLGRDVVLGAGALFGVIWFFSVFSIEDKITTDRLTRNVTQADFHEFKGHCGVYSGKLISQWLGGRWSDWGLEVGCRLSHWRRLDTGQFFCKADDDECRVSFINSLGATGNYTYRDRLYIFDQLYGEVITDHRYSLLIKFLIADFYLWKSRRPLHEQIDLTGVSDAMLLGWMKADEKNQLKLFKDNLDRVESSSWVSKLEPND